MKRKLLVSLFCALGFSTAVFAASSDAFSLKQFGMSFAQLKQSAIQGDPDAQYALGYMYYYGKDMPRDEGSARMWIAKAAAQGQPQAIRAQQLLCDDKSSIEGTPNTRPPIQAHQEQIEMNPKDTGPGMKSSQLADQSTSTVVAANDTVAKADKAAQEVTQAANEMPVSKTDDTATSTGTQASGATPDNLADNDSIQANATTTISTTDAKTAPTSTPKEKFAHVTREKFLEAPEHFYTLQIVGSHSKNEIIQLVNHNKVQTKTTYYQSSYDGKPWYVLLYGIYPTHKEALQALNKLPGDLHKLNPLVRSIASVKISMNRVKGSY